MIRQLAKSIREYKKDSILTPIFVAFEVILEAIIPFVIAQLVNQIRAGAGIEVILNYGFILIGLALLSLLFGFLSGYVCATASTGFAKNLRHDIFE